MNQKSFVVKPSDRSAALNVIGTKERSWLQRQTHATSKSLCNPVTRERGHPHTATIGTSRSM